MVLSNRQISIVLGTGLLLMVPFVVMQFTREVIWTFMDFVVAGALLLTTGFVLEWIMRKVVHKEIRLLLIALGITLLLLVWAELAVGIFGSPFAGS